MLKLIFSVFLIFAFHSTDAQKWIQKSGLPASGRHGAFGFSVGNKGYIGTGHINSGTVLDVYFSDLWEYDPGSDSWTQKADVPIADVAYGVAFGCEDFGYIGFGSDFYQFAPISNSYTQLNNPPFLMYYNVTTQTDSLIQYYNGSDIHTYHPVTDSWGTQTADILSPYPYVPVVLDGNLYSLVYNNGNNYSLTKWNENTLFWDHVSDYPDTVNTSHLSGFTLNGLAYFLMGAPGSNSAGKTCWEFNLDSMSWRKVTSFKGEKRRYYAQFQIGNHAFISTGTSGVNYNDLWEFIPKDTTVVPIITDPEEPPYAAIEHPYPNPSSDYIYFDLGENLDSSGYTLALINYRGEIVDFIETTAPKLTLNCTKYAAGTYLYRLYKGEVVLKTGKVIVL